MTKAIVDRVQWRYPQNFKRIIYICHHISELQVPFDLFVVCFKNIQILLYIITIKTMVFLRLILILLFNFIYHYFVRMHVY